MTTKKTLAPRTQIKTSILKIGKRVMDHPTAPYREQFTQKAVWEFCQSEGIPIVTDRHGNLYAGIKSLSELSKHSFLVLAAHLDHPGFHVVGGKDNSLDCLWFGGPPAKGLVGAKVFVANPNDPKNLLKGKITSWGNFEKSPEGKPFKVKLTRAPQSTQSSKINWKTLGAFGGFDFPGIKLVGSKIQSRHIDDLMGVTITLAALKEIKNLKPRPKVVALFTRAEEVGFHGALASLQNTKISSGKHTALSIETSKKTTGAEMGKGPVIRLGDFTSIFESKILYWMRQTARALQAKDQTFSYQIQLMDGGTCEGTAFNLFNLPSAGISLPLENYHNSGPKSPMPEAVHLNDAINGVRLITELAIQLRELEKGPVQLKKRLTERYPDIHKKLLQKIPGPQDVIRS